MTISISNIRLSLLCIAWIAALVQVVSGTPSTNAQSINFSNIGVIHIEKDKINEEEIFEIAINVGAKDCLKLNNVFEIITEKEDFYKIKTELEKKIDSLNYSSIEWRPLNFVDINKKDESEQIIEVLSALEELDDVQNIFTNANLKNLH